jgi:multidrug efflux pump subunit AcrA (membrane-fusion protein)
MLIRLKPQLELIRSGPESFLLLDRDHDLHFELQAGERYLLHLLTSCDSLAAVQTQWTARFGHALRRRHVLEFIEQLRSHALLEEQPSRPAVLLDEPGPSAAVSLHRPKLNFFFDVLAAAFGWLLSPAALILVLPLLFLGANVLLRHWQAIREDLWHVFSSYPLLPLLIILFVKTKLLLNLPHALFLGMVARKLGGSVHSLRIIWWRRLVPLIHVDTGVSLWLASPRDRGRALLAELLLPLVLASVYLSGWAMSAGHPVGQRLFALMVMPCLLSFVLLQCNIFTHHAAYWWICAKLRDWRLQERAVAETRAWLGGHRSPEALSGRERFWLRLYGLGYYGSRAAIEGALIALLVFVVIVERHHRDSTVFVVAGAVGFCMVQGWTFHRWIMPQRLGHMLRGGGSWLLRWTLRLAVLGGIVACGFIPYTHEVGGEFRLIPNHEYSIRAQLATEIAEVHIKPGDRVSPGSVIATLHARDQRNAVETTRHELAEAQARLDLALAGFRKEQIEQALQEAEMYRSRVRLHEREYARIEKLFEQKQASAAQFDNARYELESSRRLLAAAEGKLTMFSNGTREEEIRAQQANVDRLKAQLAHNETQLRLAEITAPQGAELIAVRVPARAGQYVMPGDLIAVLDDVSGLRAEVFATEDAAVFVNPGQTVKLRMPGFRDGELVPAKVVEKCA